MRKTLIAGLIGSAFALGGTAQASLVFDLNGTLPGGVITADAFDWAQTSFLAKGGNTAIANFVAGTCGTGGVGCQFDVLTHARLTGYTPSGGGGSIALPGGFGEITMIARFTEQVIGFGAIVPGRPTAAFETTGAGWLEFYWSLAGDSTDLTGSGFNNGTLIGRLEGVLAGVYGSFTITDPSEVPLDGFGINNYTGQMTVTGTGSQGILPAGTTSRVLDPNFFLTTLAGFDMRFADITIGLPFAAVNPSHCFNPTPRTDADVGTSGLTSTCDTDHVNGLFSAQGVETGHTPVIGRVNGFGLDNPDFIATTDFNSAVRGVPEPGTLALVGLALAGMGVGAARRRRA